MVSCENLLASRSIRQAQVPAWHPTVCSLHQMEAGTVQAITTPWLQRPLCLILATCALWGLVPSRVFRNMQLQCMGWWVLTTWGLETRTTIMMQLEVPLVLVCSVYSALYHFHQPLCLPSIMCSYMDPAVHLVVSWYHPLRHLNNWNRLTLARRHIDIHNTMKRDHHQSDIKRQWKMHSHSQFLCLTLQLLQVWYGFMFAVLHTQIYIIY